jgi:PIN like domain
MIAILRRAGFALQTIFEVYPGLEHETVSDPTWIKKCGENNWIVITGDKRIEMVPENRQAVIDAKAKVFLLNDSNTKPEVWAAAILLGQYKMQDIIDATQGPFFVTIGKRCDSHVQRPRRPRDDSQVQASGPAPVPALTDGKPVIDTPIETKLFPSGSPSLFD